MSVLRWPDARHICVLPKLWRAEDSALNYEGIASPSSVSESDARREVH